MGRFILQMVISLDGMVSGPEDELDWMALDDATNREHLAQLERVDAVVMGTDLYPRMPDYWKPPRTTKKPNRS